MTKGFIQWNLVPALGALALLVLAAHPAAAQIVVNGSFETNSPYDNGVAPSGWTDLTGYGNRFAVNTRGGSYYQAGDGPAPDGIKVVVIKGYGPATGGAYQANDSAMSQSISGFMVGSQYTLSFYVNRRQDYGNDPGLNVYLDNALFSGASVSDVTSTSAFVPVSANFTATTSTESLKFDGYATGLNNVSGSNEADLLLDNVTITQDASPAPEPSEYAGLSLTALGLGGLLFRARQRKAAAPAACDHRA